MLDNKEDALDLLEILLGITEQFKAQMTNEELRLWQRISADCADLRDGKDV